MSMRLTISIPLETVVLHTTQGARDGMFFKSMCALIHRYSSIYGLSYSPLSTFTEDGSELTVSIPIRVYKNSPFRSLTVFQTLDSLGVLPWGMFLHFSVP